MAWHRHWKLCNLLQWHLVLVAVARLQLLPFPPPRYRAQSGMQLRSSWRITPCLECSGMQPMERGRGTTNELRGRQHGPTVGCSFG